MLIFGHTYIESPKFYHISEEDAIVKTPPSSTIYLDFTDRNIDIINYLKSNSIAFALNITNLKEALFANAMGARYIIVQKALAKEVQDRAEHYLFDAKVLVHITQESELEEMAHLGIDGVLFSSAIVKISA